MIEAKSGAIAKVIHKRDANQLSGSMNWFRERYDTTARGLPVIVHPARTTARDATAAPGTRVLDADGLDRLRSAARAFAAALASTEWNTAEHVNDLLAGHHLRGGELNQYLKDVRSSR